MMQAVTKGKQNSKFLNINSCSKKRNGEIKVIILYWKSKDKIRDGIVRDRMRDIIRDI